MVKVAIRTKDAAWARRNKAPASKKRDGCYVLSVPVVEDLTFCGKAHVRFRMGDVPKDWGNRWAMLPAVYVESR